METKIFEEQDLPTAAALLKAGQLVAFPTETVYGLGANALLPAAVQQVFAVKGRPMDNPLIVTVADFQQVLPFVETSHPLTEKIIQHFWPGPLTVILGVKKGALPAEVTGGLSTAAFRMPANKKTLELIRLAGVPLVGPSANTSGRPSPTTAEHVYHDLHGKIAGILDDGATKIGVESTVLDLSDPTKPPMILRPGAITPEDLRAVTGGEILLDQHLLAADEAPKAPGMKYRHYAPVTPVEMVAPEDWAGALAFAKKSPLRIGVIAGPAIAEKMRYDTAAVFMFSNDTVEMAARQLFAGLRALDEPQRELDLIFVETFPETGLGTAYMNRLKKSANGHYFKQ